MPARPAPSPRGDRVVVALLLLLTAVSGLVDAASYLALGHVFVANMTGNIVFVGFALAGAPDLSLVNSAIAVAAFFAGALAAGRVARAHEAGTARILRAAAGAELALLVLAIAVSLATRRAHGGGVDAVVALLAGAMGVQGAVTSHLGFPGFNSTVVLTTMLGRLAASSQLAGGTGSENGRRALAIACMLGGGLVGALLTLRVSHLAPLLAAAAALAVTVGAAQGMVRARPPVTDS